MVVTTHRIPPDILRVSKIVRAVLSSAFLDPCLVRQCKRAAILVDIALRHMGYARNTYPEAGWVKTIGHDTGHVWNVVRVHGENHILDAALGQFAPLLGKRVPDIVWGKSAAVMENYQIIPDGRGRFEYDRMDIRSDLVAAVLERL